MTPLINNAPTATFMISKSSNKGRPEVFNASSSPGIGSGEKLELLWNEDAMLMLRKTGIFYDGDYLVDLNLKNFSNAPEPVIPSDVATKAYVDDEINEKTNVRFGGKIVNLKETDFCAVETLKVGSYVITVSPNFDGGSTATFNISKSSVRMEGSIVRTGGSPAVTGEMLELKWPPNDKLYLRKTDVFNDGDYTVDFNLRNITTIPSPVQPTDVASKDYVDSEIQNIVKLKMSGTIVRLTSDEFISVFPLQTGSYLLSISALFDGGPTASFAISKSSLSIDGAIEKTISSAGVEGCSLDLRWPAKRKVILRKTNGFHDGDYLVNININNFTTVPEPVIPSDQASKDYVDTQIRNTMDIKFVRTSVRLIDDKYSDVIMLRSGSYSISVISNVPGGPTALFHVSKNALSAEPNIVRVTSSSSRPDDTFLELIWPPNKMIALRKTCFFYDGEYIVDYSTKNISTVSEIILPTDSASKEYVDETIKEKLDVHFGGTIVNLVDDQFLDVFPLEKGSYLVSISPLKDGNPTAIFSVAKNSLYSSADIVKISSQPGRIATNCTLDLRWDANKKLQLRKTGPSCDGDYLVATNLKNFTATSSPVMPSDVATRSYVDEEIDQKVSIQFSGIVVYLQNATPTSVTALQPGAYTINVTPLVPGGPAGSFAICKSSEYEDGKVVEIVASPGIISGEVLHISWPANSKIILVKNGANHDGDYLVDFNLKNFQVTPAPIIPSDSATKMYVDRAIAAAMDLRFGEVLVNLSGNTFVDVMEMRSGSYNVTVSAITEGGPVASFNLCKTSQNNFATIVILNQASQLGTDVESLEM
ncbi:hypothetical protein BDK51DRAFT_40338, partial [Blyttiomyces helicus]